MITVSYSFIDVLLMGLQHAQRFGRSLEMPKISSSADIFWFVMFYFETRYCLIAKNTSTPLCHQALLPLSHLGNESREMPLV